MLHFLFMRCAYCGNRCTTFFCTRFVHPFCHSHHTFRKASKERISLYPFYCLSEKQPAPSISSRRFQLFCEIISGRPRCDKVIEDYNLTTTEKIIIHRHAIVISITHNMSRTTMQRLTLAPYMYISHRIVLRTPVSHNSREITKTFFIF